MKKPQEYKLHTGSTDSMSVLRAEPFMRRVTVLVAALYMMEAEVLKMIIKPIDKIKYPIEKTTLKISIAESKIGDDI